MRIVCNVSDIRRKKDSLMDTDIEALLNEYVLKYPDKERWVRTVVGIFVKRGIKQPTETDYKDILKAGLKEKGIKGKSSFYNYRSAGKDFYEWLLQKGDKPMENEESNAGMATEETVSEVSTVSGSESIETISDTEDTKESENVSDINDTQAIENSDNIESMKATENIKDSENVSYTRDTKKATKKGNREQISLYIDRDIYTSLKRIAKIEDTTITEIIGKLLAVFVKKNIEVLCENEEILSQMKRFEY